MENVANQNILLEVQNLGIRLNTSRGPAQAVREVSFSLRRGETLGLVGESGCGKSITTLAILGLLPPGVMMTHGTVTVGGENLSDMRSARLQQLRRQLVGRADRAQHARRRFDARSHRRCGPARESASRTVALGASAVARDCGPRAGQD